MANLIEIITKEMKIRNYSPRTIEAYTRVITDLYKTVKKPPRQINIGEIKDFLYRKQQSGLSSPKRFLTPFSHTKSLQSAGFLSGIYRLSWFSN